MVHEYGHALTYTAEGWAEQKNTGYWLETVANYVADTFLTSHLCADARNQFGIPEGNTIVNLDEVIRTYFKNTPVVFRAERRGLWLRLTFENTLYFLGSPKPHSASPRSEILGPCFRNGF